MSMHNDGNCIRWQRSSFLGGNCGGPRGPQGPRGKTGERGYLGPMGFPGSIGPTGATGPQGCCGERGRKGSVGPTGATGSRGYSGERGCMGPVGPTGATGPSGAHRFPPAYGTAYTPCSTIRIGPNEAVPLSLITSNKRIALRDRSIVIENEGVYFAQYSVKVNRCSPDGAFCAYIDNNKIPESVTSCSRDSCSCCFIVNACCNSELEIINHGKHCVEIGGNYLLEDQPMIILTLYRLE